MRRRLLGSTILIALAAVLVLGVPLGLVGSRLVRRDARAQLESESDAVVSTVERDLAAGRRPTARQLARLLKPHRRVLVTIAGGPAVSAGSPLPTKPLRVREAAGNGASVVLIAPANETYEHTHGVWLVIGLLALAGVLLAAILGLAQARRLAHPLERLAATADRLGAGDFSARAGHHGVGEIDQVADALDHSAARIARLVAGERQFSANVSHQLRSPLTALQLHLDELRHAPDLAAAHQEAQAALTQAARLEHTIADLSALAHGEPHPEAHPLDLDLLIARHATTWQPVFQRAGRTLRARAHPGLSARVSPGALGQALDVLLENALRHCNQQAIIDANAHQDLITISITDDGPGVPAALHERIFDRHTSPRGGTGLGLAVARALIELNGGTLTLAHPHPATFHITLPGSTRHPSQELPQGHQSDPAPEPAHHPG